MRKEYFFEVLGELDDDIVKGAETPMKKPFHIKKQFKLNWKVWGTISACLCMIIIGILAVPLLRTGTSGGPDVPGGGDAGGISGGGDAVGIEEGAEQMYSVAVFPPDESGQNVENAVVASLTEEEMMRQALAVHLPKDLPDGFHYGRGSHYETVMKDGTRYHMIRIEYITGTIPEQRFTEDGGAIAPDLESIGSQFLLVVWDYAPKPKEEIYAPEDVTLTLLEGGNFICIQYGDIYVGVSAETAETEAVLEAIRDMK